MLPFFVGVAGSGPSESGLKFSGSAARRIDQNVKVRFAVEPSAFPVSR